MIVIQRHGISFKKEDKTFTLVKNDFSNGDSVISPRILEIGESKLYTKLYRSVCVKENWKFWI